jgi:hypothetical protein
MAGDSKIYLVEDEWEEGKWRVEYFDKDGGCYVTIFAGPRAEERARDYRAALMSGVVTPLRSA